MIAHHRQQLFDRKRFFPEESLGKKGLALDESEALLHATLGFVAAEGCPFSSSWGEGLVDKTRQFLNQIFLVTVFSSRSIFKWHFQSTRFTRVWGRVSLFLYPA